jgi:hypothetical protein
MVDRLTNRDENQASVSFGWAIRFLPSLTDLVVIFPVIFLMLKMKGVSTLLGDGDTGWHIRTGEWILQNRQIPHADFFSFSKYGQPWFAWEWAWDVVFAWLHQLGGLQAVVFMNILLLGAIFALLFHLVRRECSNDLVSVAVTLLALAGSSIHWLARPHLVSWLFTLIFCHLLSRAARGQTKLLGWLPFLMILWTNLHGGFFLGIALVLVYAVDPLVRIIISQEPRKFSEAAPFLICGAACLLASLVNPYGFQLHLHVFRYLLDSKQVENILEFQSISFRHPLARYFELMLAVGIVAAFQGLQRGRFTEFLLILGWAHLALVSIRNIPIFLLLAAPSVARTVAEWSSRCVAFVNAADEFHVLEKFPRFHLASAAVFGLLLMFMAKPGEARLLRSEYDPANYPSAAVEHLRASHVANVFTDDEWGDYLIYRMYPTGRVFVDGRSDFYGADFESRYLDLMNVRYDWETSLVHFGVDTVLLRVQSPLAGALKQSARWQVVYDDGIALIFVRKGVDHSPLFAAANFRPAVRSRGANAESQVQRSEEVSGKKLLKGERIQ